MAPPSAAELPFFRLSSPRRCGESGEKRLRRLLIASPEWHSQAERYKLVRPLALALPGSPDAP